MTETGEGEENTAKGHHDASPGAGTRLSPPKAAAARQRWGAAGFALHTRTFVKIPLKKTTPWMYLLMLFYSKARHCGLETVGLV